MTAQILAFPPIHPSPAAMAFPVKQRVLYTTPRGNEYRGVVERVWSEGGLTIALLDYASEVDPSQPLRLYVGPETQKHYLAPVENP